MRISHNSPGYCPYNIYGHQYTWALSPPSVILVFPKSALPSLLTVAILDMSPLPQIILPSNLQRNRSHQTKLPQTCCHQTDKITCLHTHLHLLLLLLQRHPFCYLRPVPSCVLWILSLPISLCSFGPSIFFSTGSFPLPFKYAYLSYFIKRNIISQISTVSVNGLFSLGQFTLRLFELAKIALFYFLTFQFKPQLTPISHGREESQ